MTVHCIIGAGTEGSAMSKKKNRPHGYYCKICGEYKANEKFSGKGHAAHICKACSRLSAAEKAEYGFRMLYCFIADSGE